VISNFIACASKTEGKAALALDCELPSLSLNDVLAARRGAPFHIYIVCHKLAKEKELISLEHIWAADLFENVIFDELFAVGEHASCIHTPRTALYSVCEITFPTGNAIIMKAVEAEGLTGRHDLVAH